MSGFENGLLLINKPSGITSHDVVKKVKRLLKVSSVGHAGTLDPMATGLMVILVGEATKLSDYILNGDKGYALTVKFGLTTDTLDITGAVLSEQRVNLSAEDIEKAAMALQGQFLWPVPLFSAVKVEGKKLYSYAHQNQVPQQIPLKTMEFKNLRIMEVGPDYLQAHIECSKGSYIRAWAQQLGEKLGVGGVLAQLQRTSSQPFAVSSAISLEELERDPSFATTLTQNAQISLEQALQHWPTYSVRGRDETLLFNGQVSHDLERRLISEARLSYEQNRVVPIRILRADSHKILAILQAVPERGIKIKRVFKMT